MYKNRGSARNRMGVRVWWEFHSYFGPSFYLDRWCVKDGDKQVDGKVWWAFSRWFNRAERKDKLSIEELAKDHVEEMEMAEISPDVEWPKPQQYVPYVGQPLLRMENTPVFDNANQDAKDAIAFFCRGG